MQLRIVGALAIVASIAVHASAAPFLVRDIDTGSVPVVFSEMVAADDAVFFTLNADGWGSTLWRSDGTADGTRQLLPDPYRSRVSTLQVVHGLLFFSYIDARGDLDAWRSDGTSAGTFRLATVFGDGLAFDDDEAHAVHGFVEADGGVFFAACERFRNCTLWATDGTQTGTRPLVEFNPNVDRDDDDWDAPVFDVADGTLRFVVGDSRGGYALWRSDGTPEGTVPTDASDPPVPTARRPVLYYGNPRADTGVEPWRYDPVAGTSSLLGDLVPGPRSSDPSEFIAVGETVFFVASDGSADQAGYRGRELWKTDGTPLGTVRVADLSAVGEVHVIGGAGGTLFLTVGSAVWRSDGTTEGTIALVDFGVAPAADFAWCLASVGGMSLFSGYGADGSPELWRTNGTPAGTRRVIASHPGTATTTSMPSSSTTTTTTIPVPRVDDVPHIVDTYENGRHGSGALACAGQTGMRRLQWRLDRARALLDRASVAIHPRKAKRLLRRAARSLGSVTASLSHARGRGLSRGCTAALADVVADATRGLRRLRATLYSRP
jgi:ELWxxDGT repeat protein